jgi:hypothetical protein
VSRFWEPVPEDQMRFVAKELYKGILYGGSDSEWEAMPDDFHTKQHFHCIAQDAIRAVNYYRENK